MHEYSLALAILDEVARVVIVRGDEIVEEIHVEFGPLSGVESLQLASAFDQAKAGTCAATARLVLHNVALVAVCRDCGREFEPERFAFTCPACGGLSCTSIQGDRLILKRIVACTSDGEN